TRTEYAADFNEVKAGYSRAHPARERRSGVTGAWTTCVRPRRDPCVAEPGNRRTKDTEKPLSCSTFAKPSDGLEPSTPSLPWKVWGVTRVHARSLATQFLLQIGLVGTLEMRRATTRVSFLMCPF